MEVDQSWVRAMGDIVTPDRWLYGLLLCPGDELIQRPLTSEDKGVLRHILF